jgi:hypothetical protein
MTSAGIYLCPLIPARPLGGVVSQFESLSGSLHYRWIARFPICLAASMSPTPPPPEPFIVGVFAAMVAAGCVMLFRVFVPGIADPNGYGFTATVAVGALAGWGIAKARMNRWHRMNEKNDADRT